jgi:hypothetical protein
MSGYTCEYVHWNRTTHRLQACGVPGEMRDIPAGLGVKVVKPYTAGSWKVEDYHESKREVCLCPEHAECLDEILFGIIDTDGNVTAQPEFAYKLPNLTPKVRKPGKPTVKHTVIPPSARRLEYVAWKAEHAKQDKGFIQWALDENKRAIAASEPSPFTADGQAKIAKARAKASPYDTAREKTRIADIERQTGMRPDGTVINHGEPEPATTVNARIADYWEANSEPNAATVCGFRFEYRAEGGSGFYWNGKRVASTREGLERMGPAILAKVCK